MNNHIEMEKIKSVIQDYMDGTYEGDGSKLKGVFHDNAVMNGYLGKELLLATPAAFIEDITSSPSMKSQGASYNAEIESIVIEENIASVILSETGFKGNGTLVNHFHIIEIDGKWKIISKLFTSIIT